MYYEVSRLTGLNNQIEMVVYFMSAGADEGVWLYSEVWSLSAGEKFDEGTCKAVDLSPCIPAHGVDMGSWRGKEPNFSWVKVV